MQRIYFALVSLICISLVASDPVLLGLHGSPEYVDLVKGGPRWASVDGSNLPLDQEGFPTKDFVWIFDQRRNKPWNGPDFLGVNDDASGVYWLSFKGKATLNGKGSDAPDSLLFSNQTYDPTTMTTTVAVEFTSGHFLQILNFIDTERPGQSTGSGVTDVKFVLPGYLLSETQLFTTRFLDVLQTLKPQTFRSFDTGINSYPIWYGKDLIVNTWAERSLPTDAYWPLQSRNVGDISGLGMPWEIYMQICIQSNIPGWFNLPVGANDDYILNFAKLLKNGNSFTKPLNPDLPFYIEYSNEVWNWGFSQSIYNEVVAKQDNVTNLQRYIERAFQISDIFRTVYGDAAIGTTVRVVAMWQYGTWQDVQEAILWAQQKFGKSADKYIWGIGEAPYVNPTYPGHVPYSSLEPNGVDHMVDSFYTEAGIRRKSFAAWQSIATFFGIHVVGYESGPSLSAGIEGEVTRSPRLKDFEKRYFMENWFALGCETVNFFALGPSGPGPYGDWYLFEHWGEYDYGKFQGYLAVSGQPVPPLTVGYVLGWTNKEAVIIDGSQYDAFQKPGERVAICNGGCWPTPAIVNYLLRSTSSGTYELTVSASGQPSSQVQIWFNNMLLKVSSFPQTGGNVSVSFSTPKAGLYTLSLAGAGSGATILKQGAGLSIQLTSGGGTPTVPSAPINLIATALKNSASFVWEPVTTATSYSVLRSSMSGGPYDHVGNSNTNNYTDANLQNDVVYYYVVTASNEAGTSALSPQVPVKPFDQVAPVQAKVTIKSGVEYGNDPFQPLGQSYIYWDPVPNSQLYEVKRGTSANGKFDSLGQLDTTYFYDSGLTLGGTYYYQVIASNRIGSSTALVSTSIPTTSIPGDPTGLAVKGLNGKAYLTWLIPLWSFPEFGELFRVERAEASNGPWVAIESVSTADYVDVVGTTKYCYRVWATNGKGGQSSKPTDAVCL